MKKTRWIVRKLQEIEAKQRNLDFVQHQVLTRPDVAQSRQREHESRLCDMGHRVEKLEAQVDTLLKVVRR